MKKKITLGTFVMVDHVPGITKEANSIGKITYVGEETYGILLLEKTIYDKDGSDCIGQNFSFYRKDFHFIETKEEKVRASVINGEEHNSENK